jgi:ATP synthase protein I
MREELMGTSEGDREERELKARLDKLSSALGDRRDGQSKAEADEARVTSTGQAMSLGFRVLSEFVAGVIVGAFIGWQLDSWLGTAPIGFFVFLMLGMASGFWNVYRLAAKTGSR